MPRDFKSFAKEHSKDTEKIINENKEQANQYEEIINKYKNMNQNDNTLFKSRIAHLVQVSYA